MSDVNPRAASGDNTGAINYAEDETKRLRNEYGYLETTALDLLAKSKPILIVDSSESKDLVKSLIKNMRDAGKRILGVHEAEKMPHLERGRAADNYFFGINDRLLRRGKTGRAGEGDRLNQLLTDYDVRILAAEQERRRKEAAEAERIRQAAEAERIRKEQEAEEARLAAERARKPETTAAKQEVADQAADAASTARVEETVASARAEDAYVETLARPQDIMRDRSDDGILSTMGSEKFAEITDKNTLDLNKLRPYLAPADLEKALRRYADSVAYSADASVQIAGARFGKRPKSLVR